MKKFLKFYAKFKIVKKILKLIILSKLGKPGTPSPIGQAGPVANVGILQRLGELIKTGIATVLAIFPK